MSDRDDAQEAPRKRGRPPRVLLGWGTGEHDEFMAAYRAFMVAHNYKSREDVDRRAGELIAMLNRSRGVK